MIEKLQKNQTFEKREKSLKNEGCTNKITNISTANYPRVLQLVLYQCIVIVLLPYRYENILHEYS